MKSKIGFGYHLLGIIPSNQQICPPVYVAIISMLGFLLMA